MKSRRMNNAGEPRKHRAKGNKPDAKGHLLQDWLHCIFFTNCKEYANIETGSGIEVARGGAGIKEHWGDSV